MRTWRILIIILVLLAAALLAAASLFEWNPWQVVRTAHPLLQRPEFQANRLHPPAPLTILGALFALYISSIILLFVFPRRVRRMAAIFSRPWLSWLRLGLLGLLAGLLVAVAGFSSALAMGTFPLTLFLGLALFFSSLFGAVALAYFIGSSLLAHAGWQSISPLTALFLGELVLFALINVPGLGVLAIFLLTVLGLGSAIATRFGSGSPWSLLSLEEGNE